MAQVAVVWVMEVLPLVAVVLEQGPVVQVDKVAMPLREDQLEVVALVLVGVEMDNPD